MAIADYLTQLASDRDDLADNLVTMGVQASHSETITELVPKVLDIAGGGIEITDITLNADGTYTVTDKDNNTHTLAVTETDGQITAITYDGDNVSLSFSGDDLTGVGDTDVDVSRYKGIGRLPAEYQEVEYIESTGTQYIDTGVYPDEFSFSQIEVAYTDVTTQQMVCGAYSSGVTRSVWVEGIHNQKYSWQYPSNSSGWIVYSSITPVANQKISSCASRGFAGYAVNNDFKRISGVDTASSHSVSLALFGSNWGTEVKFLCQAKLYSCQFYSGIDTKVAHFIPCYRKSDNEIGMYDIIRNQFFTNAGTGTFLKGGDV